MGLETSDTNITWVMEVDLFDIGNSSARVSWDIQVDGFPEGSSTIIHATPYAELFLFGTLRFCLFLLVSWFRNCLFAVASYACV